VELLKGERWVHAHILNPGKDDDPRGILLLLRLADEFGFHVATFQHAPAKRAANPGGNR